MLIFRGLDFEVFVGLIIVVVGLSGFGKSFLGFLLLRLYDLDYG